MEVDTTALLDRRGNFSAEELQAIDDLIIGYIEDGIVSKGYHLLSKLGQKLGSGNVQALRNTTGKKLTDYVREKFGDRFDIVPLQSLGKNTFGIVSGGSSVQNAENHVLQNRLDSDRFNRHFWAAFSVPLPSDSHVRFINLRSFYFEDRDQSIEPADNEVIIDSNLIPPTDAIARDEQIKHNINRWLDITKIDRQTVLARAHQRSEDIKLKMTLPTESLLDLLLSTLDRHQLHRISLPLDVVATLIRKRI